MSIHIVPITGEQRFEVYFGGRPVGLVWKASSAWLADRYSTANPAVCETSKDAAIQCLISRVERRERPE